ncbi:MAG: DinB family protein [Pirellulaceae bacterium]
MMQHYLARMFAYVAWADRQTIGTLRATPAAEAEALPLLAHVLAAEHVWLARLTARPSSHPVWPTLTLEECVSLAAENDAGYRALLKQLSDDDLAGPIRYRTSQGQEFETPRIDILTQVVTHGPYHRGQIAKVVARHGGTVANTDFITFARVTPT